MSGKRKDLKTQHKARLYPLGSSQRGVEHTWNVTARCAGGSIPVMEVKEKVEGEKEEPA